MRRLLLAVALGAGLLSTAPAGACDWEHCPGTSIVCQEFGCPLYCTPYVAGRHVCLGN